MKADMKGVNYKVGLSFVFLMILGTVTYVYKDCVMGTVRIVLEAGITGYLLGLFVAASLICHTVACKHSVPKNIPYFRSGFWLLDIVSNIATYSALGITSVTLIKGVYVQKFFGDTIYFAEFKSLDLYSILAVCAILLWYVIFNMSVLLKESLFVTTTAKDVNDTKDEVNVASSS